MAEDEVLPILGEFKFCLQYCALFPPSFTLRRYVLCKPVGLREVPRVKDWSVVRKMSLMYNEIQEISSSLTTLMLIIRSCGIWEIEIGRMSWDIILTRKD
ncbi:hypothetical protein HID58_028940 [Brassica napus]|uniref:Uncharacterized protein n=1 Tax=Brassica napus TaxID=3708 RepID=A0ABQ8CBN1_BRANA|nr:hypothetical protein HID58_028940 [Brassica napus]